jgi:molecular chaperone GrpE
MADSKNKSDGPKVPAGHFEADVGEDVIREALESVRRISIPPPAPTPAAPPESKEVEVTIGPPLSLETDASEEVTPTEGINGGGGLNGESAEGAGGSRSARSNEELEKELAEVKATLELSATRAKETLDRLKDTHERQLRAVADLENYKKRAAREREEAEKFAIGKLVKELLSVLDNLDRALEHSAAAASSEVQGGPGGPGEGALATGVQDTRRLFEDILAKFGVRGFSAKGLPFDPNRHEAIQQVPTSEVPPGTVATEIARGYLLNDRLLRPALVGVAAAPPAVKPAEDPNVREFSGSKGESE